MTFRFASISFLLAATSACGSSSELVSDGAVDAPPADAPSDVHTDVGLLDSEVPPDAAREACVAPGASRAASCGNCGTQSQRCVDGFWTPIGECLAQGECSPGAVESRVEGECVPSQRVCTASCEWLPWEAVGEPVADAECSVGQLRWEISESCRPNHYIPVRCNETTCRWERGACEDACAGEARRSPWYAEEICIPGGELVRGGHVGALGTTPVGLVTLSPFYIDRYPVTVERYQACVEAGVCFWQYSHTYREEFLRRPAHTLRLSDIEGFCAWDGGRRLPSEAEWELAAKGPAPRNPIYTWTTPDQPCVAESPACGTPPWGIEPRYDVDALPIVRSAFGVDMMLFGVLEWTRDTFDPDFYERTVGTRDPVNLSPGGGRVFRGFASITTAGSPATFARWLDGGSPGGRCVRTP
jgi:formylglycine-generating enzyme required for sulfatase activity